MTTYLNPKLKFFFNFFNTNFDQLQIIAFPTRKLASKLMCPFRDCRHLFKIKKREKEKWLPSAIFWKNNFVFLFFWIIPNHRFSYKLVKFKFKRNGQISECLFRCRENKTHTHTSLFSLLLKTIFQKAVGL